jgi:hypothetical protein
MISVLLHIGPHKTGNKSLQNFLQKNKLYIKRNGVEILNILEGRSINEWALQCLRGGIGVDHFNTLLNSTINNDCKYIISSEVFSEVLMQNKPIFDCIINNLKNQCAVKLISFKRNRTKHIDSAAYYLLRELQDGNKDALLSRFNTDIENLNLGNLKNEIGNWIKEFYSRFYGINSPKIVKSSDNNTISEFIQILKCEFNIPTEDYDHKVFKCNKNIYGDIIYTKYIKFITENRFLPFIDYIENKI